MMLERLKNWTQPDNWLVIKTIDLHTGGEPLRVILDGIPPIPGNTILEKRRYFRDNLDFIRTALMWEPRGHADMYGAVITEPTTPDGDFGTFFLHNEGYSTMCGHAMIALATLALDTGMITLGADHRHIRIDAPPGRIIANGFKPGLYTEQAWFTNVPSFVLYADEVIQVPGIGPVRLDVAFGGAFYAVTDAEPLGLKLDSTDYQRLIDFGRRIKQAVINRLPIIHPFEEDLGFLYGTIFTGQASNNRHHSRNVCIFANGEVDRSATGSGVSARAAIHYSKGELIEGKPITIESIIGSTMDVEITGTTRFGNYSAIISKVSGTASITGRNEFYLDPGDPLKTGFLLR